MGGEGEAGPAAAGRWQGAALPASFVKSARWYHAKLGDSLTLLSRFGPPTFFLTLTCNPHWPEIRAHLKPGVAACEDPILACQIFSAKLKILVRPLEGPGSPLGGRPACRVGVIEFQKWGLPHAHLLLYLEGAREARLMRLWPRRSQEAPGRPTWSCGT